MRFLVWNVQGLRNGGWMEVAKQISSLNVDIAILTETNLLPSQSLSFPPFDPNYSCISATSTQRGSGISIVLNSSCEIVNNPIQSENGRRLELSIKYQQSTILNILAIYAPGSKTQRENWYNQFLNKELSLPELTFLLEILTVFWTLKTLILLMIPLHLIMKN
jgi:exonuclease III